MSSIDILYLSGAFSKDTEDVFVSIETYICLFVYHYCDLKLAICLLPTDTAYPCRIPLHACRVLNIYKNREHDISPNLDILVPAVVTEGGKTVIAGLCGVLRWSIKTHLALFPNHHCEHLLGFRGGCLVACTESSIWTRFCELQLPNSVSEVSSLVQCEHTLSEIPKNLVLLEAHLKRPVRTHNILKRKLDIAKRVKQNSNKTGVNGNNDISQLDASFILYDQNCTPVADSDIQQRLQTLVITEKSEDFALDHCFLEGIDFTLADMIVFPCVHYLLNHLPHEAYIHLVNVVKWHKRMFSNELVKNSAEKCGMFLKNIEEKYIDIRNIHIGVPNVEQMSLYKRDPTHTRLKCKHQSPQKIISLLNTSNIYPNYSTSYCDTLDWASLPPMLHPATGDLPKKRIDRKCQQIESIVTAVLKIAKENQIIVEFCAGGGHVGLLLAHFLPSCKVLLIENKESSIMRAKYRSENLSLKNVFFYQCNLDYFKGSFDIGVSLHACGVATDLVIQQCIKNRASFVCCPCCYGSIQNTHLLHYPLSEKFKSTNISLKDYTLLAHFADRNEVNTPTAEEGEVCMGLIDTDRAHYAEEQRYEAILTTLQPITCSPKHNLIIGISPCQRKS